MAQPHLLIAGFYMTEVQPTSPEAAGMFYDFA